MTAPLPPPPGWYPDPEQPGQRWWDGSRWGVRANEMPPPVRGAASPLYSWGWVTAILLPPVGFIIGLVLAGRGEGRHGATVIVASVVMVILGLAYVALGVH